VSSVSKRAHFIPTYIIVTTESITRLFLYFCHIQVHSSGNTSLWWSHLQIIQACLLRQPPFLQHFSWQCCNPLDIPSSTAEILLFNSVFHDGVTPVSVSTLKLPLRVIGVLPMKPQVSSILSVCI